MCRHRSCLLLFAASLLLVSGCDVWTNPTQRRVIYQIAGHGDFPATVARVEYTNLHGRQIAREDAFLPYVAGAMRPPGSVVHLEVMVEAPANRSGFQVMVIVDEDVAASEAVEGFDSDEVVTQEVALSVTLP
jgi:hypothetical protein